MITKHDVAPESIETTRMTPDEIKELLRSVIDPDLGMSIVDLGLVYRIENKQGDVEVDMTLTSPACPYGPQLVSEVSYILHAIKDVGQVKVEVVWDPPWSTDFMSEAVKLELGMDL